MTDCEPPVAVDHYKWPEARAFQGVYCFAPELQTRLVKALFGFREELIEAQKGTEVEAIEVVIRAFAARYPEFMQEGFVADHDVDPFQEPNHVDERLRYYMAEIAIDTTKEES